MTAHDQAVAKQYQKWKEADASAHRLWEKVDFEARKFVRIAKVGRKARAVVPITEGVGVEIRNQFRGEDKVFAPAFARKWKFKEVALDEAC